MNGNSRLYRSTSEATIGGVAAGLGNYFKIDPTLVKLAFIVATILTGGGFLLVYLAMWLLIPTAASTATEPTQVIHENLNDIGDRVRGFMGNQGQSAPANGQPNGGASTPPTQYNGGQISQVGTGAQPRQGIGPMALILIGGFFLLANLGFFRIVHWGVWWPLLLVGLGVIMLTRRR